MRKKCSEENTKGVAETPFDKICMGANHKFDQSLQKKPGRDDIIPGEILPGLRPRNERQMHKDRQTSWIL